jgi:hypothetical protein
MKARRLPVYERQPQTRPVYLGADGDPARQARRLACDEIWSIETETREACHRQEAGCSLRLVSARGRQRVDHDCAMQAE